MKKKEVLHDSYFTQLVLYIHNNPVKHGFANNPYDWNFSSIHYLSKGTSSKLSQETINWFGGLKHFQAAHSTISKIESVFD
jgi:hypothetical protein